MQQISISYTRDTSHYLTALKQADGLIWYHEGIEQDTNEWLSAWPTEEYEYWGEEQICIRPSKGTPKRIRQPWNQFLIERSPNLEAAKGVPFTGGLAGHLSYDLGLELHNIPSRHPALDQPLAVVGLYHWALYIDHNQQQARIIIQDACPNNIRDKIDQLFETLQTIHPPSVEQAKCSSHWTNKVDEYTYQYAFERIKDYLLAGDCYQVNLTRQWLLEAPNLDDLSIYQRLSQAMPAPFSVFQRCQSHSLLSVSPERFIRIENGIAKTQPIKGTRTRGQTQQEDDALKVDLSNSTKDRAENLMIVDLLRNDLARNAMQGSVNVDALFELQTFKNVHHLVSTISATMKADAHPIDILLDAFPGGSITGAPKKRAMEVIDELEWVRRGNYCGCSFYLTANQTLDSNILIRTVTQQGNRLTCSGGGGIVIDSECAEEYRESDLKVRRILESLGHTE